MSAARVHPELIRIAARQVRLWRGGAGPNLLLLHGGFGDAQWHWHTVWDALAESFTIAAPDLPRFGGTVELPNAAFTELLEWLARVQELVGMPRSAVVGSSFGAAFARLYAANMPTRVSHLVLVDGGQIARLPRIARVFFRSRWTAPVLNQIRMQAFSEWGVRRAFGNPASVSMETIKASQATSHGFVALMRQTLLDDVPAPRTPQMPTLIIWGERDRLAKLARAYELAAELPGAQLAVIKHAGHLPQLEDPLSFVKILRDFILET